MGIFLFSFSSLLFSSYFSFTYYDKDNPDVVRSVGLPFKYPSPKRNVTYVYEGYLKCPGICVINKFKIVPDDRILEFKVNGQSVLKNVHGDLGDMHNGVTANLDTYLHAGLNHITIEVIDYGGIYKLSFSPNYLSTHYLGLIVLSFISLFLLFSQFFRKTHATLLALSGLALIAIALLSGPIRNRLLTELSLHFTVDTLLYWTVGHGIAEGFKPWLDFFEGKPPFIFYLSALSLKLSGNYHLTNYVSIALQSLVCLAPIFALVLFKPRVPDKYLFSALILWAVPVGMLCMLFTQIRAAAVQIESFGAGFVSLYLLCISNNSSNSPFSLRDKRVWLAGLCIMLASMTKEPFYLICLVCGLILSYDWKMFFRNFIVPSVIAGIMAVIFMSAAGILFPYLTIYLPSMAGNPTQANQNFLADGFNFSTLYESFKQFSPLFWWMSLCLIMGSLFASFVYSNSITQSHKTIQQSQKANLSLSSYFILKAFFICYLTSLSIRMSIYEWGHTHVYVIPVILASYVCFANTLRQFQKLLRESILVLICCTITFLLILGTVLTLSPIGEDLVSEHWENDRPAKARYIDQLCDALKIERYQYIGNCCTNDTITPYTRHLPQGPFFVQFENVTYSRQNIAEQINRSNLLIVSRERNINTERSKEISQIINRDFTAMPPEEVKNIIPPAHWNYDVYYRKNLIKE